MTTVENKENVFTKTLALWRNAAKADGMSIFWPTAVESLLKKRDSSSTPYKKKALKRPFIYE